MEVKLYPVSGNTRNIVINDNGEELGTIDKFLMDLETGRLNYAILAFSKSTSATRYFAVPWELLRFSPEEGKLVLNVSREMIEIQPGSASSDQVMAKPDITWLGEIYNDYLNQLEWEHKRLLEREEELKIVQLKRETINRSSLAYYWWRDLARRKVAGN